LSRLPFSSFNFSFFKGAVEKGGIYIKQTYQENEKRKTKKKKQNRKTNKKDSTIITCARFKKLYNKCNNCISLL
jgi:hypothetical protein